MNSLQSLRRRDRTLFFETATDEGRIRRAQKVGEVDARRAKAGERIVSIIAGEGLETVSRSAREGDWVVRSRCAETGHEEQLVDPETFKARYAPCGTRAGGSGFARFIARWSPVRFCTVREDEGHFAMLAPWGELQRYAPGDAVVQLPGSPSDIYRVHRRAFALSYKVLPGTTTPQ